MPRKTKAQREAQATKAGLKEDPRSKTNGSLSAATNGKSSAKEDVPPPSKRARLLSESESEDSDNGDSDGGVKLTINEEYAKRFEYNKKREERQRLEEKYGKKGGIPEDYDSAEESDSESDESEDEVAELATEKIDREIEETLKAIRSKDPRVFDPKVKFFTEEEEKAEQERQRKEKAVRLADYHRKNLLEGYVGDDDDGEEKERPKTFAEEQEELRSEVVGSMNAAAAGASDDDDDDAFLVEKPGQKKEKRPAPPPPELAEKDPENFLSNFLASRAWVAPTDGKSAYPALESDDSEFEENAERVENEYNLRFEKFENPLEQAAGRTQLLSHARDVVASQSVRKEEKSARKKAREAKRAKKDEEKKQREIEKARLKALKIEEVMEKVEMIREAAGIKHEPTTKELEEWKELLDGDFSDEGWEREMRKRFGDGYYEEKDKKPTWDDDIDIKDIVPDFKEDEEVDLGEIVTGNDDADEDNAEEDEEMPDADADEAPKPLSKAKLKRLATSFVTAHPPTVTPNSSNTSFRYREVSPTTYGLTSAEILTASDAQLNEFVGLKKLAPFRPQEKKQKDKKRLAKKKRLREWRESVFGRKEGLRDEDIVPSKKAEKVEKEGGEEGDIREGKRKRKRRKH